MAPFCEILLFKIGSVQVKRETYAINFDHDLLNIYLMKKYI